MQAYVLSETATALETTAGASTTANATEAGYWERIRAALETLAGTTSSAADGVAGDMLRAAVAAEAVAGTSGAEENDNKQGKLKRLVDALEVQAGAVTTGSLWDRLRVAAGAAAFTPFTAIAADGWQATVATPVDLSLSRARVSRQGYDTTGTAATISDTLYLTKRVRQAYPSNASLTANNQALSDYVYSTDTISGATNNSTLTSPKPIACWAMPQRQLVGNSVHWEIAAFHRNARLGKQVACVQVRANDGTTQTAWQTVSTTAISTIVEDAVPVETYSGDIDVTALATGAFWLEAKVYPWFGAAAAVLSSEDQTNLRDFYRAYFVKNTTTYATPPYVYVASTGNDSTGVVSTTAATALASPCLTIGGAIVKARAALGATSGAMAGLRIRIVDSITCGNPSYNSYGFGIGSVIIERAPGTARAAAIVNIAATFRPMQLAVTNAINEFGLIFSDVSLVLGGAYIVQGEATCKAHVQFWNCNINFGSFATGMRGSSHVAYYGVAVTNAHANTFSISAPNGEVRMMRGITGNLSGGAPTALNTIGCSLTNASAAAGIDVTKPVICYANKYLNPLNSNAPIYFTGAVAQSGVDLGAVAIVQNLVETIHTSSSSPSFRVASDGEYGNIVHAVIHHNTILGAGILGRSNMFYDEHGSVARNHKLASVKGNIFVQLNTKGDIFTTNGARLGNFAFTHGVGCEGNFTMYQVSAVSSEAQAYPGIGSNIGTSTTARNDPLFTSYAGTTYANPTYTAGAGGGDYTLQGGSPARDILSGPLLGFDMAGVSRGSGMQHAGAYIS